MVGKVIQLLGTCVKEVETRISNKGGKTEGTKLQMRLDEFDAIIKKVGVMSVDSKLLELGRRYKVTIEEWTVGESATKEGKK